MSAEEYSCVVNELAVAYLVSGRSDVSKTASIIDPVDGGHDRSPRRRRQLLDGRHTRRLETHLQP
jgi:hypothetical protein